ncbi:pyridoxamine 5'-phosphate oxidase family protein [Candidatus Gracilibacteria bacterium]|nr:pyridoxamine 5'-phosphate oxidase family protein [Candidatus Gracilibacteria bacterium]
MDYQALLQEILTTESYLCLATSTALGQPWATPLCFISDEKYRLYFISQNESLHALHIAANPHVAFSIFNTRQPIGNAFGSQGTGIVKKLTLDLVPDQIREQLFSLVSMPILQKDYSFFMIEIDEIYLPDAERWKIGNELRTKVEF